MIQAMKKMRTPAINIRIPSQWTAAENWHSRWSLVLAVCLAFLACGQVSAQVIPLPRAHAHNDYHHDKPLLDALQRGFCSVEADVFLVDGELWVGHDKSELRSDRTLKRLYLDPLLSLAQKNGGRIYPDGPLFTLLVDFKENGRETYAVLRELLANYKEMVSSVVADVYRERAVQVIISGDRPFQEIAADKERFAFIDGRLDDLDSKLPAHLLPLISDRWTSHFSWRGEGEFPATEREKLLSVVQQAHAAQRRVRFWATPEKPRVWQELVNAGVDYINTDQLDDLREFLLDQSPQP